MMKLKAKMGHYSSVVGNSVHLIAEDGRMAGQVAIIGHLPELRGKEMQHWLLSTICDAINATPTTGARTEEPEINWRDDPDAFVEDDEIDVRGGEDTA